MRTINWKTVTIFAVSLAAMVLVAVLAGSALAAITAALMGLLGLLLDPHNPAGTGGGETGSTPILALILAGALAWPMIGCGGPPQEMRGMDEAPTVTGAIEGDFTSAPLAYSGEARAAADWGPIEADLVLVINVSPAVAAVGAQVRVAWAGLVGAYVSIVWNLGAGSAEVCLGVSLGAPGYPLEYCWQIGNTAPQKPPENAPQVSPQGI